MAGTVSERSILDIGRDGLLLLAGLGLAWAVVSTALTVGDANPGPQAALHRIREDPLDIAALRGLGLERERTGRTTEAEALLSFVGRRTWRDAPTQAWLLRRRLSQGRLEEAFETADSILRQDWLGATRPALFGMMTAAAGLVEARPSLEARLAAAPSWRTDFLQGLDAHGDAAGAVQVLVALAAGGTPPKPEEYTLLITRLVAGGDYKGAHEAWSVISRRVGVAELGDFSGPSDQTPFTWSDAEGVGATSEAGSSPDGSALRIDYDGFSTPRLPARLLVSPSGRWRLTWRETGDAEAPRRLYWRVRCAQSGQVLARSDTASPGGRDRQMAFEIPATGCGGQWLELIATPAERRDPVTASYESMKIAALP
jgi:hypothetical protein